jgi:hypothetical protein
VMTESRMVMVKVEGGDGDGGGREVHCLQRRVRRERGVMSLTRSHPMARSPRHQWGVRSCTPLLAVR